jgi:hypothetical protein
VKASYITVTNGAGPSARRLRWQVGVNRWSFGPFSSQAGLRLFQLKFKPYTTTHFSDRMPFHLSLILNPIAICLSFATPTLFPLSA